MNGEHARLVIVIVVLLHLGAYRRQAEVTACICLKRLEVDARRLNFSQLLVKQRLRRIKHINLGHFMLSAELSYRSVDPLRAHAAPKHIVRLRRRRG